MDEKMQEYWTIQNDLIMRWTDYRSAVIAADVEKIASAGKALRKAMKKYETFCITNNTVVASIYGMA